MRTISPALAWGWLLVGAIACGSGERREPIGHEGSPIIAGTPDEGHPAIVGYLKSGSICTATIVAVDGTTGYALTAAHCLGADLGELVVGPNMLNTQAKTYKVTKAVAHPSYAKAKLFDIAMLTFTGADAMTPVMTPLPVDLDTVKAGSTLDLVGYGLTMDGGGQVGMKQHKTMAAKTVTPLRIVYDQKSGGLCSGDSGGPSLFDPQKEYVAGVHSFVSGNNGSCLGSGTDIRVSPFVDTFINPYIEGKPFGLVTCSQCAEAQTFQGQCSVPTAKCFSNAACVNYDACLDKCSAPSCELECAAKYPSGKTLYDAVLGCLCATGCKAECAEAKFCANPACDLYVEKKDCQACVDASCCAEAQACAKSGTCLDCASGVGSPITCASDATSAAYEACASTNCASECGVAPPPTTAASGSGGAGGDSSGAGGAGTGTGGVDTTAPATSTSGAGGGGLGGSAPAPESSTLEVESGCTASGRPGATPVTWAWAVVAGAALARAARKRRR